MGDAPEIVCLRQPAAHPLCEAFRLWLASKGYEDAVEVCPVDGGEYVFATPAHDLIDDFIDECAPGMTSEGRGHLETYASELGYISDIMKERDDMDGD